MIDETILEDLNDQQRQAVCHVDGPLLVIAGAGSGKTRVITRRVAYLIARGVEPQSIVAITFTNKAANEMLSRVRALLDNFPTNQARRPIVATFHAFSTLLLRIYGRTIGLDPNFTIFDQGDRSKLIKLACGDADALPVGLTAAKVATIIEQAKCKLIRPDQLDQMQGLQEYLRPIITRIYRRYQELLQENSGLDFDDLLARALELFEVPDTARSIRRRYQYLLIDEYQDTNRAQYLLAKQLAAEGKNICATGDPDQAIYAWRGADLRNILEFQQDFPDAKVVYLEKNYRSTGHILHAADAVIKNNRDRKEKTLIPVHETGLQVQVHECDDEDHEADQVVDIINQSRKAGIPLSEIGVFCRVNALLRNVEMKLLDRDIPYELARGVGFFQRREIRDLVSYLRVLVNPADQIALERIINTPPRGIGARAQDILKNYAREQSITLFEAIGRADELPQLGRSVQSVTDFAQLLRTLEELKDKPDLRQFINNVIDLTGLGGYYEKQAEKHGRPDELSPVANLKEFVSAADVYRTTAQQQSLQDFLAQISLISDVDSIKGDADRVTLLTMHAAKGLEFAVVIIVATEEDIIPHALSAFERLEEERRLFFVAMTRAKRQLHICYTQRRATRGGSRRRSTPSRFLKEIDPQAVEGLNLSAFDRPGRTFQFVITPRRAETTDRQANTYTPRCPYRTGQRIYHEKFGHGVIQEIHLSGNNFTASINFHGAGVKKIVLDRAPIQAVRGQ